MNIVWAGMGPLQVRDLNMVPYVYARWDVFDLCHKKKVEKQLRFFLLLQSSKSIQHLFFITFVVQG